MKIYLIALISIFTLSAFGARFAYTANSKTLVYADSSLQVPIGYIKTGRKIKVGDKSFKNRTITTIIVAGRVAYIKTDDIRFEQDGELFTDSPKLKEHDVDILFMTAEDKLKKYNHFAIEAATITLGSQWEDLVVRTGQAQGASSALFLTARIEHLPPMKNYGFSFALNYLSASEEQVKLSALFLEIEYQYRFFQTDFFSIEAFAGALASGEVRATTIEGEISDGAAYGYKFGARARIMPFSKLSFFASVEKYSSSVNAFEPLTTTQINDFVLDSLGGTRLAGGISFGI